MRGIFDWYYSLSFLSKVAVGLCGGAAAYYLAVLFFGSIWGACKIVGIAGFCALGLALCIMPFKDLILDAWNFVWDLAADAAANSLAEMQNAKAQAKANAV
jgi:hypothetical protein